jgi:alpha-ribazole phosphatase
MKLHLLRHPQPQIATGICYGQADIPADPAHLDRVLRDMRGRLPHGIPIYSSPLSRCSDLAQRLVTALDGCVLIHDIRLQELDFGTWELCAWDDIPRVEIDAWAQALTCYRPGNGESLQQMAERILDFLQAIYQTGESEIVLVTHAGCMRMLAEHRPGISAEEMALAAAQHQRNLHFGQYMCVDVEFNPD